MDSLVIDIQSTSTDATKGIDTLIAHLSSLRDVLKEVSTASNGLSNLKKIGNGVRASSGGKRPKIEQPQMLYKNIDVRPAFEKMAGDISKVDSATSMLRNKFNTLGISLKDTKIISTFSDANKVITKYVTKTGSVITVTDKLRGAFNKVDVSVKKTNTSTKKFSDDFKKTTDIINKVNVALVGIVAGFVKLAQKMGDFVNQAGAEQEALNLFTVTMGRYAKQGVEWIERFSDALYLDPVSVMQYMGSFNSLVKGLGVGAENSYKMSQNLTQLVYDLSSFKNITIESAYEKLMSGVSGELEPLRNVGVAMSEATLQTLAYELGIEKLVRNMTEAEKAQLRYIQIMRSSTEWQTDMGRTLITPTNALRVMRQQFTLLGRAIGKVFIPIVMEAIPYVIAITQLLTALANKIANLLGYKIADIDYSSLGEISAGIQDIGDSAEDTAHKLNTMLAPFDDLNVVQKNSDKSGSGLSAFGGDLGVDLPTYDALANLNTKFAEGVKNAKKNLEDIIPLALRIGGILLGWKIAKSVVDFISFWKDIGITPIKAFGITLAVLGLTYIFEGVKDMEHDETFKEGLAKSLGGTLAVAGGTFMLTKSVTLTLAVTALSTLFASGVALKDLLDMKPTFDEFVRGMNELPWAKAVSDYVLTPIFIDAPKKIEAFVIGLGTNVGNWISDYILTPLFIDIPGSINRFLTNLATNIGNWVGDTIWDIIDGARKLKDGINNKLQEMRNEFPTTWSSLWSTLSNKFNESKNGFLNGFDNLKANISNKLQELKSMFSNWKATLKTPHLEWKQNGIQATGTIKKILETLNLPTSLPKLNVAWYEQGGFPTSGDLFFANENGVPEMIGRIGNQTAVANNDQIATSLTNALISALNQYDFGGGQSPTTIYIGNRKVYEGYGEHVANENDRYGTNMIKI